jgi:hypothetical protein
MNQESWICSQDEIEREQRVSKIYLSMFAVLFIVTVITVSYMNSMINLDPHYVKSNDLYLADNQAWNVSKSSPFHVNAAGIAFRNIPTHKANF